MPVSPAFLIASKTRSRCGLRAVCGILFNITFAETDFIVIAMIPVRLSSLLREPFCHFDVVDFTSSRNTRFWGIRLASSGLFNDTDGFPKLFINRQYFCQGVFKLNRVIGLR